MPRSVASRRSAGPRARACWKLLLTPGVNTRIIFAADYSFTSPASAALNRPAVGALTVGNVPAPARFWDVNQNFYERAVARQGGASLTIDQDLGAVKLRSITAYRENSGTNIIDLDGTQKPIIAIRIAEKSNNFTQEVQLISDYDWRLNWIVGAFYLRGLSKSDPSIALRNWSDGAWRDLQTDIPLAVGASSADLAMEVAIS